MVISTKKKPVPDISIYIEGHLIDKVSCTKFLGVFIDEKLNWKRHINYVSGKISRGIGVILKARKSLNRDSLITLYHSFIYPDYTYCNHVWGATYASNLRNLVLLQKRCVRIICNEHTREHTEHIFKELGFLKFEDINKYMIGRFMHRWHNRKLP